jgi:hypothetical protein
MGDPFCTGELYSSAHALHGNDADTMAEVVRRLEIVMRDEALK